MIIRHRGLYHDRLDAPFIGSLLFAVDCHHGCKGCCHSDRHNTTVYEATAESIVQEIEDYGFSEGIIFGGFEWTEQPEELLELVRIARLRGLQVILYTHHTESELKVLLPRLYEYKGIYVKYGEYVESLKTEDNHQYGVPLASENQYIRRVE